MCHLAYVPAHVVPLFCLLYWQLLISITSLWTMLKICPPCFHTVRSVVKTNLLSGFEQQHTYTQRLGSGWPCFWGGTTAGPAGVFSRCFVFMLSMCCLLYQRFYFVDPQQIQVKTWWLAVNTWACKPWTLSMSAAAACLGAVAAWQACYIS